MFPPFYLVTPWYGTFAGGGGRTFTTLAAMFHKCGIPTTVLTTCSKSPYEDWRTATVPAGETQIDGITVRRFTVDQTNADPYHAAVTARLRGLVVPEELQEAFFTLGINSQSLIDYVGTLPPDAVVIAGHYFQSLVPSLINSHPNRVVAIPAFHDEPEFYWTPIRRVVENAKQILFLSEEEKDLAIRAHGSAGGQKLIEAPVVGLGAAFGQTASVAALDREAAVRRFDLPQDYLVYVGRVEPGKGLSYLIPWVTRFNEQRVAAGHAPVPLILVGSGPPNAIEASPFVRELGFLSEQEKVGVMQSAIALINPSTLESFSYVVMEAWLAGIPVLVPAECTVTAAHVRRCKGGLVFQNEETFSRRVEELLSAETRRTMAVCGRRYVEGNFRWPDVIDRMLRAVLQ